MLYRMFILISMCTDLFMCMHQRSGGGADRAKHKIGNEL